MLLAVLIGLCIFNTNQADFSNKSPSQNEELSEDTSEHTCVAETPDECEKQQPEKIKQCKICGLVNFKGLNPSIVNGIDVDPPYAYPWMVAIERGKEKICGAAILSSSYILTAAHCITKRGLRTLESDVEVQDLPVYKPDEIDLGFLTDSHDVKPDLPIEEIIPHPDYHPKHMKHDIALIKLKGDITCDRYKLPICLPPMKMKLSKRRKLFITGWGASKASGLEKKYPKVLQQGYVKRVRYKECKRYLPFRLQKLAYCLQGVGKQRPCFGDSGGSMFIRYKKLYITTGVASMHTCHSCKAGKPFVYTAITQHLSWIANVTGISIQKEEEQKV